MKKAQMGTAMVGIFIALLIGVIVVGITGNSMDDSLNIRTEENESHTLAAGETTLDNDGLTSLDELRNSSMDDRTTECNVTLSSGELDCNTTAFTDDKLFADYKWKPDNYIESGMTRTILNYVPLMLGVALIVFLAGFVAIRR